MRYPSRSFAWLMLLLVLYPILVAGCGPNYSDTPPPNDPKVKAVWEKSQARHDARKANGAL